MRNPVVRKKIRYRIDSFIFPRFFLTINPTTLANISGFNATLPVEKPIAITCLRKVFAQRIAEPRN